MCMFVYTLIVSCCFINCRFICYFTLIINLHWCCSVCLLDMVLVHYRIDAYIMAWTKNVDLQPLITKMIKQELIAVFIQALHRNE